MAAVFELRYPDNVLQMDLAARLPKILRRVALTGAANETIIQKLHVPEWAAQGVQGWFVPEFAHIATTVSNPAIYKDGTYLVYAFRGSTNTIHVTLGVM